MEAALLAELQKFDEPIRGQLQTAYLTNNDKQNDQQKKLLEDHPSIGKLHPGVLYQYNQKAADTLKEMDKQTAAIWSKKPDEEFVRALTEPMGQHLPITTLFYRGDFRQPQQEVKPGGLTVAAPATSPCVISDYKTPRST